MNLLLEAVAPITEDTSDLTAAEQDLLEELWAKSPRSLTIGDAVDLAAREFAVRTGRRIPANEGHGYWRRRPRHL